MPEDSSNTKSDMLPAPSSITQNDAAAGLIISDHSSLVPDRLMVAPASQKSPKFASQNDDGPQEDLEQLVQLIKNEKIDILCQLDDKLKENV